MKFPLADWIDLHSRCRYNLGASGMRGTVRPPVVSLAPRRSADAVELRKQIGELLGVSAARVFMTHGATEANSLAVTFLARRRSGRTPRCRVELPEYPPLFDLAHWAGFRVGGREGSTDLAIVSQPRNPVGDLWSTDRLEAWAEGARALIVDESFREFTRARSVQRLGLRGLWTTGTFTKAYGADDLRVGFVAAPANERASFARYHGLATDELPPYSVTGALATLAARERILRDVRAVVDRNQALWRRSMPGGPPLAAPIAFDDPVPRGGDPFSRQCLAASVLVCPGSYFGRPSGVRVGLTRRSFPRDLAAYLRVRTARAPRGQRGSPDRRKVRRVDRSTG